MARYTVHIGYGKTGSTALQKLLSQNRKHLLEKGVLYPDLWMSGSWLGAENHNQIGAALAGKFGWWKKSAQFYFRQIEETRKRHDVAGVVLSGERFLGAHQPWDFDSVGLYRQACAKTVEKLRECLAGHDVEIYVFLRRQDEWLESVVNQTIKYGGLQTGNIQHLTIKGICQAYYPRLNYKQVLLPWEKQFGREHVHVLPYPGDKSIKNCIISDFLDAAGLGKLEHGVETKNQMEINSGLSRDLIEIKSSLNKNPVPKYRERVLVEALYYAMEKENLKAGDWPILTSAYKKRIMLHFSDVNSIVFQRYRSRFFKKNIFEMGQNKNFVCQVYPGLSEEKRGQLTQHINDFMDSKYARLRILRHAIAQVLRNRFPLLHSAARLIKIHCFRDI